MTTIERSDPAESETDPPETHVVVALVGRKVSPFELAVVHEVFALERPEYRTLHYDFRVVGAFGSPVEVKDGDWKLSTPWRLDALDEADTLVIAAWPGFQQETSPPEVLEAVRAAHRRGARLLSVCTGAFLLAEAGVLDGRRATTHWIYADELARRFPLVDVDPNVLYVDGGDGIYTSAGTAAGIDLCLYIVRQDHGATVSNAVARRMVVPPQRDGGQAQYVATPMPVVECDTMAPTLQWAMERLEQPLQVEDLARRAMLSPRTFARRFRAVTGTTPMQWLTRQRVLQAQQFLETSDMPIELIAQRCGLGSGTALRSHFGRIVGTSPLAYRRTFRCPEEAAS